MYEPVEPFLARDRWYIIINNRFIGPFDTRSQAQAVYAVAVEIAKVAQELKKARRVPVNPFPH